MLRCRFRRRRRLEILNVPPGVALRSLAGPTARAFCVAERQAHLEREVGAQEVWQVGAVGTNNESHRVFPQTEMVEQDIARAIAQHLMQRFPRERGVEWRVKKFFDPGGIEVFGLAIP